MTWYQSKGRAASVTTEAVAVPSTSARPPRQRTGPGNQQTASTLAASDEASRPRQRTREERDALRAQRTCNGCGERGHYWRQCPRSRNIVAPLSSHIATTTNPQKMPAFIGDVTEGPANELTLSQATVDYRQWCSLTYDSFATCFGKLHPKGRNHMFQRQFRGLYTR